MMDIIINQIVKPHFNEKKYCHVSWQLLLSYGEILLFPHLHEFNPNPSNMAFKVSYNRLVQPPLSLLH